MKITSALLSALLLTSTISARNGADDIPANRTLSRDISPQHLRIKAPAMNTTSVKNTFRFDLSTNGFPSIRTASFAPSRAGDNDDPLFTFRTGILRISEFNATIRPSQSTSFVSFLKDRSMVSWSPITATDNFNGTTATRIATTATGSGSASGFTMLIEVFVTPQRTTLNRVIIDPSTVKYSITLNNFPYKYVNGKLAIHTFIASKSARANNGTDVIVANGAGSFGWDKTALADGTTVNINVMNEIVRAMRDSDISDQADDGNKRTDETMDFVTFSVDAVRPAIVYWDPVLGMTDTAGSSTTSSTTTQSSDALPRYSSAFGSMVIGCLVAFFLLLS